MPLYLFYTMVQKSRKWPKTQIKGVLLLTRAKLQRFTKKDFFHSGKWRRQNKAPPLQVLVRR